MKNRGIRVLVIDDSPEIAAILRRLIDASLDLVCVGTLERADAILSTVESLQPDVVLLDLRMPGKDSLESIAELSKRFPQVRTIAFSGHDDPTTSDSVLDAGGWGLVSKSEDTTQVLDAIRLVAQGQMIPSAKTRNRGTRGPTAGPEIAVLCVDDNSDVLGALRQTLSHHNIKWSGSRPDATDLHDAVEFHRPSVVVLDLDMPGRRPLQTVAELARQFPEVRVVVYSAHVRKELIEEALEAGVWGYISKSDGERVLVDAIRQVSAGRFVMSPEARRASAGG